MKKYLDNWQFWLVVSLTLGLAPFVPEPHIVGKVRWILGGAKEMKILDWFDFVQHGFPFFFFLRALFVNFIFKKSNPK